MKASELKAILEKQIEHYGDRDIYILDESEEFYKDFEDVYARKGYVKMGGEEEEIFSIEIG